MSVYNVVDTEKLESDLTGVADEVRTLADTDSKMSLEVMKGNIAEANEKVDSQSAIISQIKSALQGKVAGSGGEEFIGIKYLNYSGASYNLPTVADARSLDKILIHPDILTEQNKNNVIQAENSACLNYAFANTSGNANGGYFAQLEEAYLPTKATGIAFTFQYCTKLKRIYGDLTNIRMLNVAFDNCKELEEVPYMPKLTQIGNNSFRNCYKLKKVCLPISVTTIHTGAFNGCTNPLDIYVGFGEGAVANAPWGATNATIHYNTQYDENGNPITA